MTQDVIDKIGFCVERIESEDYSSCPKYSGLKNFHEESKSESPYPLKQDPTCKICWKKSCLSYIRENAPCDKVVGARYMVVVESAFQHIPPVGTIGTLVEERYCDYPFFKWPKGTMKSHSETPNAPINHVRRISDLKAEDEAGFKFGDVVRGTKVSGKFYGDIEMESAVYTGEHSTLPGCTRVFVLKHKKAGAMEGDGYVPSVVDQLIKIGRVSCSEETLRGLIAEKNVDAIKAMIKLDKPDNGYKTYTIGEWNFVTSQLQTKEDKPMEIKDKKLTLNGKTTTLTDEQMKELGFEPKPTSVFERVESGKRFNCITSYGNIETYTDTHSSVYDTGRYNAVNYFADTPEGRAVAHQFAMHQELWRKLTKFAMENGGVPKAGTRYCHIWRLSDGGYRPDGWIDTLVPGAIRFASRELCQRAIDEVLKPYLAAHPDFEW